MRGAGRNFDLLTVYADVPTTGVLSITLFESNSQFDARPWVSFQPFVYSPRNPTRTSKDGRILIVSSA